MTAAALPVTTPSLKTATQQQAYGVNLDGSPVDPTASGGDASLGGAQSGATAWGDTMPGWGGVDMSALTGGSSASGTGAAYGTPGANIQDFGDTSNLVGSAILPGQSAQTQAATAAANNAYGNYANTALPTWNASAAYQPTNAMQQVGNVGVNAVAPTDFSSANSALNGGLQTASQLQGAAAGKLGGLGVSYDNSAGQSTLSQATNAVGSPFNYSGDTNAVRAQEVAQLNNLQPVDRQALALQTLSNLTQASDPAYQDSLRQVGQKAAAFGRVGSGITTTELGDLALQREKALGLQRSQLATDAASQTLQDQQNILSAQRGVASDLSGMDQAAQGLKTQQAGQLAGIGATQTSSAAAASNASAQNANVGLQTASQLAGLGNQAYSQGLGAANFNAGTATQLRNDAVDNTTRQLGVDTYNNQLAQTKASALENGNQLAYQSGVNSNNATRADQLAQQSLLGQKAGALGNYAQQGFNNDVTNTNALTNERNYENQQSTAAQNDRIQQAQFAQWLQTQGYQNANGLASSGFGNDPSGALNTAAGQQQTAANGYFDDAGSIASLLAKLQAKNGTVQSTLA